ncbi:putative SOS response-associated peptidase YedK [Sinorhizobium fredii]
MKNPRAGDHELFGFLTCDANEIVKPIHPNAMPVILTKRAEIELWLTAEWRTPNNCKGHTQLGQ